MSFDAKYAATTKTSKSPAEKGKNMYFCLRSSTVKLFAKVLNILQGSKRFTIRTDKISPLAAFFRFPIIHPANKNIYSIKSCLNTRNIADISLEFCVITAVLICLNQYTPVTKSLVYPNLNWTVTDGEYNEVISLEDLSINIDAKEAMKQNAMAAMKIFAGK